ncbi:MAG: SDR family NAD(P)-dependent oxidoreductase [Gemmatimonadaceae bacterium]
MRFQNRVVVITGLGGPGQLGEALARAFSEEGARIVAVDRSADKLQERVSALQATGIQITGWAGDLADERRVGDLARSIGAEQGGQIHAVVHLAGGFAMSGPVADSDLSVLRHQVEINVVTAYLVTRAFLPLLRPTRGALLFLASSAALPGAKVASMSAYAAAKGAVVTLMRAVADEERGNGVRANALAPSAIRTAANIATMGATTRYVEREDVAAAAVFLCSDAARAITGQTIALA